MAMDKSAASKMGVTTVIWLLSGLGSVEELEIFAVLEMVPEALAERVPRRKMVTEEPAANFMESLPKREVLWARRKSKVLLVGGIALAALVIMAAFYLGVAHAMSSVQFVYFS